MMKNRDTKNLSLPLSSVSLPATVSGINRNSPSRASIKIVLPPVVPDTSKDESMPTSETFIGSIHSKKQDGPRQMIFSEQPNQMVNSQLFYDVNNYYSSKPSMQQIPEQSTISMFKSFASNSLEQSGSLESERISPGSSIDQFKYNRYSSASLDSGRGSDSVKLPSTASNRVSVHSCESIGSTSSNKDSDASQQSSSLSSSSSTSSSFCSSSSSSSYQNHQYYNKSLSSSSSGSHVDCVNPVSEVPMNNTNNNVFVKGKPSQTSIMASTSSMRYHNNTEQSSTMPDLVAQAGPLSIAEMILHGVSDFEMIHIWLQKIHMNHYESNFIDAAYDMATISRMTPQDLTAIGITDPQARSVLTNEIQKLKIPESLPSFKPNSLEEWLKLLNLECYYHNLCQQGYTTVDRVTELTWEDLEDVGINKLGHQKKILLAIKKIKSLKSTPISNSQNLPNFAPVEVIKTENIYSARTNNLNKTSLHPSERTMPTINGSYPLPYQDVPIKMYANVKLNSPNQTELPSFEERSIITQSNVAPSVLFGSKPQMRTFQQLSDVKRHIFNQPNNTLACPNNTNISSFNNSCSNVFSSRGRSLESLDNPDPNYLYNGYQYYAYDNANQTNLLYKPTYQYSSGDLHNINRQTICYETNNAMNTFAVPPQLPIQSYEIDGTATLNRPKNLIKNKPIAKIVASSRQPDVYENFDSASIKSNDSSGKVFSDTSSDTGSIYSTLKKKPPPPPKRVNSIRKPNSLPTTPVHHPSGSNLFNDQGYLNNNNLYDNIAHYNGPLVNDDMFASCVKNMTTRFSEMHSLSSTETENARNSCKNENNLNSFNKVQQPQNFTLPMNKKEKSLIENINENINQSSSSSTESMPFANDNIGTIRQKSSNFLQNAMKLSDNSKFSSSSSSSSTSSPLYNKNISMPNSAISSPSKNPANMQNFPVDNLPSSNDCNKSRQSVVDSLEDIEIMLANLKTQLDSID